MHSRAYGLVSAIAVALAVSAQAAPAVDPLAPTAKWTAITRGDAAVPPMGWNSWNAFLTAIDEEKVMGTAEALVSTGLARLGYRYVNIDDGWWHKRRQSDGRMQIRTNIFPSAKVGGPQETSFRPLTDKLHAMGLKAGIYSDIGHNSCSQSGGSLNPQYLPEGSVAEREIGLAGNVDKDIQLYFKDWGFDYIKVDACGVDEQAQRRRARNGGGYNTHPNLIVDESLNRTNVPALRAAYQSVSDALQRARPNGDYVFSICAWGAGNVRAWGKEIGNVVRTSSDILPVWGRMLHVFDSAATRPLYAHPGAWNDPDMLFIGHGEFDVNHLVEAKSHFSLWAVINAPLLIGYDMRNAPKSLIDIWGNADLVAANQDKGGHQAVLAYDSNDVQIFVKTLAGTDRKIVAIFNRGVGPVDVLLMAKHLKFADGAPIVLRDLWSKATLDPFAKERSFKVAPRETLVFEASGTRALPDGQYLSEIPGRINVAHDGVVTPQADPTVHRSINPWEGTNSGGTRAMYAGWGGAMADQSPYGGTLLLRGEAFMTGIGILTNSRMEVRNDGAFRRFSARVGIDDNSLNTRDGARFLVYADGRLVAQSRALKFGDAPAVLTAVIGAAKIVELVVRQASGAQIPASAVWADAALLR
ncbi:NPCBM/NEW2 domain-containing protein [Glacieibacterium frigidum]|uniref:Alpha-galactosidase n=1 Tax=Glacieibacterium frigidum TaxID=2593303 RepID=A0A552UGI8_9SPHN|nr:NPCBM/NEW2 domain-containing protein [Glacieibacterium frigidum]TRW17336.1 alpha-galactosidase [Glacieibacterium frigidum]